jgi:catechol 2,3-dioxygenase-like lactoylglutathione lyase family enzyme
LIVLWESPRSAFKEIAMLADIDAQATVPARDLSRAKAFYQDVLGLKPVGPPMPGVQCFLAGRSVIVVYETPLAGTNQATAVTWALGAGFDAVMGELKAKGVSFERYALPNVTMDGDVHVDGQTRVAWFKDPDGNIINLGNY